MMLGKNKYVDNLLHRIREGTIGAEIGVWQGESTAKFLKKNLTHLHICDPYKILVTTRTMEDFYNRYSKVVGSTNPDDFVQYYDDLAEKIQSKFGSRDDVTFHRCMSDEFFAKIQDNELDWVYIDGDHSKEGVLRDLYSSLRVVKSGGQIFGDDYRWGVKHGKQGVIEAVDQFREETGLHCNAWGETNFEFVVE